MRELRINETITLKCVEDKPEGWNCDDCAFRDAPICAKYNSSMHCEAKGRSDGKGVHFEEVFPLDADTLKQEWLGKAHEWAQEACQKAIDAIDATTPFTWEDIKRIVKTADRMLDQCKREGWNEEDYYQKVLKNYEKTEL